MNITNSVINMGFYNLRGGELRGGGHSGPARLHNFPRQTNLNLAPNHLRRSSQRHKCRTNVEFHPILLAILPHFDPKTSSLGLLEAEIVPK